MPNSLAGPRHVHSFGFLQTLVPAKALPSDGILIFLSCTFFVAFALTAAAVVGFKGYLNLSPLYRIVYYGVIVLFGILFSAAAVQCAIPGARVRVDRGYVTAGSLLAVAFAVAVLFRNFSVQHFLSAGLTCLRLGCVAASLFAAVAILIFRRGYVTDIGATALLIGSFAGFSGVAVLSLQCTLHNAAHIIVWHLGAMLLSTLSGYFIGELVSSNISAVRS